MPIKRWPSMVRGVALASGCGPVGGGVFGFSMLALTILSLATYALIPNRGLSADGGSIVRLPSGRCSLSGVIGVCPIAPKLVSRLHTGPVVSRTGPRLRRRVTGCRCHVNVKSILVIAI